jgi:hypothetical protein
MNLLIVLRVRSRIRGRPGMTAVLWDRDEW